ncbi:hypothetical protein LCGC14_3022910, partial [marine sediment metagenome]
QIQSKSLDIVEICNDLLEEEPDPDPPDVTLPYLIGNPAKGHYPKNNADDTRARTVWDMQAFNDNLYIGSGDISKRRGPAWIYRMDTGESLSSDYKTAEHEINLFRVFGQGEPDLQVKTLADTENLNDSQEVIVAPGIDCVGDNLYGTRYAKSIETTWTANKDIPNGQYVRDIAYFKDGLYVFIRNREGSFVLKSPNWNDWTELTRDRMGYLVPFKDELIIMGCRSYQTWDGDKLVTHNVSLFPDLPADQYTWTFRAIAFGNSVYYTREHYKVDTNAFTPLYMLDVDKREVEIVFAEKHIMDIVPYKNELYILTPYGISLKQVGSTSYKWERIIDLDLPALPWSLEILNGKFYVGLGYAGTN